MLEGVEVLQQDEEDPVYVQFCQCHLDQMNCNIDMKNLDFLIDKNHIETEILQLQYKSKSWNSLNILILNYV